MKLFKNEHPDLWAKIKDEYGVDLGGVIVDKEPVLGHLALAAVSSGYYAGRRDQRKEIVDLITNMSDAEE